VYIRCLTKVYGCISDHNQLLHQCYFRLFARPAYIRLSQAQFTNFFYSFYLPEKPQGILPIASTPRSSSFIAMSTLILDTLESVPHLFNVEIKNLLSGYQSLSLIAPLANAETVRATCGYAITSRPDFKKASILSEFLPTQSIV